jgi:hypothetical protein
MDRVTSTRRRLGVVLVGLLLASASGCKGIHGSGAIGDAGPTDGAAATSDASPLAGLDAAPADDLIPATSSDELTVRARHLLEAITKDDADLATDIIFPRAAWLGLRDAADPAKEWDKKVDRPFRRALHALSRHADGAQFVSLELGRAVVQETVRRHGWKKALWSVHGSRLTYVVDGHTHTLSIREMTAWRGAWYVTRLR